jgi:dTDP-4-amino-4,6-dideoxygalactose transaminase
LTEPSPNQTGAEKPAPILPADPKSNYLAHRKAIDTAIAEVLAGGWYILGPAVKDFERAFAAYCGVEHGIGVGSGTEALHLALRACGIGPGDAVITVSHTAVATVAAIELSGATPVLIDIDPVTFTLSPVALESALKRIVENPALVGGATPRAVIAVHLYGHPADMTAIGDIAQHWGLQVIEDCAQAHGARIAGTRVGSFGCFAEFSFYPTKNLGALGDGGALVTNDPDLAEQARLIREYGWRDRYISLLAGMNTRLDELQAAVLSVKLPSLDAENARRREIARLYNQMLAGLPVDTPACAPDAEHVYHQYVIRTADRDALRAFLTGQGIGTLIHYPVPVHQQPAYETRGLTLDEDLPVTEQVCQEILSLPMHPHLADAEVRRVGEAIQGWCKTK